ncbi:MAG: DNA alkylation repair protein [Erysipelotrichaceae bacterium]
MFSNHLELEQLLLSYQDLQYQTFLKRSIPNYPDIIGIRMTQLHLLSKQIVKENREMFYQVYRAKSHEERLLYGLCISQAKQDKETYLKQIKSFLPYINNWAICDSAIASFKFIKNDLTYYHDFVMHCCESDNPWIIRFSLITLLNYYHQNKYLDEQLEIINKITDDSYYVRMGMAWLLSMLYVLNQERIILYLKQDNLDVFTHNKTIQKIIESRQVRFSDKEIIRKLKR